MVWQDIALMIANLVAAYAIIPQVYHGFKNKTGSITLQTGIVSTICVFAFAIIFASMSLFLTSAISTFNAIMWSLLLVQRIKYGQPKILKANNS